MTHSFGITSRTYILPLVGSAAIPWRYMAASNHAAEWINAAGNTLADAHFGTDFNVSPSGDTAINAGTLTLIGARPTGAVALRLYRQTPPEQYYVATPGAQGVAQQLDRMSLWAEEAYNAFAAIGDLSGNAASAAQSAAEAALYEGVWIDTLAGYATDAAVSYNTGPGHVVAGDFIRTRKEGISLQVLAANAISYTHINALGVKANLVSRAFDVPASFATMYDTGKFEILGGVLRQNPMDRTRWEFLTGAHQAVGFDPDPNMLASDGITPLYPRSAAGLSDGARKILAFYKRNTDARRINFSDAAFYDRIVSCIVTPDEVTASQWGLSIGARCTRSGIDIRGSMHKQRHARIYWDSSASTFVITEDGWHPAGDVTVSWDATAGILTVNHAWLPGNVLHLQADMRATDALPGGSVPTPFIPVQARIVSNTQFTMRFLGDGAGPGFTPRTGAASSGMSFRFTKSYHGELLFNGENGFDSIDWSTAEAGNLWCMILMRREAPL